MKKLIALIMVFAMIFSVATLFAGCDEEIKKKPSSNRNNDDDDDDDDYDDDSSSSSSNGEHKPKFDEESVLSQLVVEEYRYHDDYGYYCVLSFENLSDYDLNITTKVDFFDASNKQMTEATRSIAIGSGGKNLIEIYSNAEFARIEYTLSASGLWYDCVASELSCESVSATGMEIVTVTNESENSVTNIQCTAVFWKDEEIVDTNRLTIDKLKSGKSKSVEMYVNVKEYDTVDFYFSGTKVEGEVQDDFDEEAVISRFSVEEYRYQASGKYYAVLVVENTSIHQLNITADVQFYSAGNKLFSAKEGNANCVGINEKTVFYFSQSEEFARIEYTFSAEKASGESADSHLAWESLKGNNKEIITVTNTGSSWVKELSCTILFWNHGSLVHVNGTSFWNLASEMSAAMEVDCNKTYDTFDVYWTAVKSDNNPNSYSADEEKEILSDLKVEEYRYERKGYSYADYYGVLVVENTSDYAVKVSVAVKFYNDSNKLIGTDYESDYWTIGNGAKTVFQISQPEKFARMEYEFFVSRGSGTCAVADLSWTVDYENKTISVTNEGEKKISNPSGKVIYWQGEEIVYVGSVYFYDSEDSSFDPGDSITESYYCYDDHDSLQLYLNAHY